MKIAVIGGSGLYSLLKNAETKMVATKYGKAKVHCGKIGKNEVFFVARHGEKHTLPPHRVNYKANISALKKLGVEKIIATAACGAISKYAPGDLVIAEDMIGFFAPITFFDGKVVHTDFSHPYSQKLNKVLIEAAKRNKINMKRGGIIATMRGPRFETPAEIRALKSMGANLVNMTNAYECVLSREVGIEYSTLIVVTNYAAGISKRPLSHKETIEMVKKKEHDLLALIKSACSVL